MSFPCMTEWPTLTSLVFHDLCAVYILTNQQSVSGAKTNVWSVTLVRVCYLSTGFKRGLKACGEDHSVE